MGKDNIELPPLPSGLELWNIGITAPDGVGRALQEYAIEAIKADRQQRWGEPVAYAVFADNGNIRIWQHEPLDWPEAVPLYSAPQPAAPAPEPFAYATHHDEPMLFLTHAEAASYCDDDEKPIPLYAAPQPAAPDNFERAHPMRIEQ